ncbi:hypothetical protein ABC383_25900 [Noviherbaspirillum sp. 1P10PC]|uniref:hypothetical protein n=1 Tax=Noviherbaspirillum sp. 1P10PC TaxID=3132292 RepID=UPI0039A085C6
MKKSALFPACLYPTTLLESIFRGWSAFVLVLGMLAALMRNAESRPIAYITIAFAAVVLIYARRNQSDPLKVKDHRADITGVAVIAFLCLLNYVWALKYDSIQPSDFGVYFRCGIEKHDSVLDWMASCQSNYLHANLIYWSRSLLYSIPFGIFAGPNYTAFKLYNASFHVATIVIWFFGLRYYFGPRVAIVATLFLALYPEWWFTTTLITSDNAAIFFIAAFFLLVPQLQKKSCSALIIATLPFVMFAANQLRTVGLVLMATIILMTCFSLLEKWNRTIAVRSVAVLGLYFILNAISGLLTPSFPVEPVQFIKYLSAIDFSTVQDFSINYQWSEHFWLAVPPESRSIVGWSKALLELAWGFDQFPFYLYKKAEIFFSGTGYHYFSSSQFGPNADTVLTVPKSTVPPVPGALPWMTAAVTFYIALSFFALIRSKLHGPALVAMVWLSVFTLMILGLGEVQPRYSVLIAPALSILAAVALFPEKAKQSAGVSRSSGVKTTNIAAALFLLCAIFGIVVLGLKSFYPATAMPGRHARIVSNSFCDSRSVRIETSYKRVRVILPKGVSCGAISVPLGPSQKSIAFFASGAKFPFPFEPKIFSPFRYTAFIGDKALLESELRDASVKWHRFDLSSRDAKGELTLIAQRREIAGEDFIDFWFFDPAK